MLQESVHSMTVTRESTSRAQITAPTNCAALVLTHKGYRSSNHAHESTRIASVFKPCCVTFCLLVDFLGVFLLYRLFDVLHIKHTTRSTVVARVMKRCDASICPHVFSRA